MFCLVSKTSGLLLMVGVVLTAFYLGSFLGMTTDEFIKNILSDIVTSATTVILFFYILQRREQD